MKQSFWDKIYDGCDESETQCHLLRLSLCLSLVAVLLLIPCVMLHNIPFRDVAMRYAPMAEAFGKGDYPYAFHPRIPLLHPLLGGICCRILGCDGFTGVKIASMLCFALTFFPLMGLMRHLYGGRIGIMSGFFFLSSAHLFRFAYSGFRESLKGFLLVLAAYGVIRAFEARRDWRWYLLCGVVAAMMCMTRVEMIFLGAALIAYLIWLDLGEHGIPWRSLAAAFLSILLLIPALLLNQHLTGRILLDVHLLRLAPVSWGVFFLGVALSLAAAYFAFWLMRLIPSAARHWLVVGCVIAAILALGLKCSHDGLLHDRRGNYRYLISCLEGLFSYFVPATVIGILTLLREKRWRKTDTLILTLFLLHALSSMLPILVLEKTLYVSPRYLYPGVPLTFGWAVTGWVAMTAWTRKHVHWKINGKVLHATVFLIGLLVAFVYGVWPLNEHGYSRRKRGERLVIREFSRAIRTHEAALGASRLLPEPRPVRNGDDYHSNSRIRVSLKEWSPEGWHECDKHVQVLSYLAGGRLALPDESEEYLVRIMPAAVETPPPAGKCIARIVSHDTIYEVFAR